jgi:hypothetical protein
MALVADSLPEIVSPPANILVALWDDIAHPIIVSAIPGKLIAKHGGLWTIQVPLRVSPTKTRIIQRCVPHSLVVLNPHDAITPDDAALTYCQRQSELPPDLLYPDSLLMAQWPDETPHHTFWAAEWLPVEQPAPTPSTDPLASATGLSSPMADSPVVCFFFLLHQDLLFLPIAFASRFVNSVSAPRVR